MCHQHCPECIDDENEHCCDCGLAIRQRTETISMKSLVYREPDSLLWVAERPRLDGTGECLGWYTEWFDEHAYAFAFAALGPIRAGRSTDG